MTLAYAAIARRVAAADGLMRTQAARWPEVTLGLVRREIQAAMEVIAVVETTAMHVTFACTPQVGQEPQLNLTDTCPPTGQSHD
jgi:hypothetical protein